MPQPLMWHMVAHGLGRSWLSLQGHFSAKKNHGTINPCRHRFIYSRRDPGQDGWQHRTGVCG